MPYESSKVQDMENSNNPEYRLLSKEEKVIFYFKLMKINCSGQRTIVYFSGPRMNNKHGESVRDPWEATNNIVQEKVLSDKRSAAFATTISVIKGSFGPYRDGWWLDCKDCDSWYKSERTVLSEAR